MSRLSKVVVTILVVVLVVLLVMWYVPLTNTLSTGVLPATDDVLIPAETASSTPTSTPPLPKSDVAARDASDASLEADLSSIDEGLKQLTDDAAAVDKSLNDTPISQNI